MSGRVREAGRPGSLLGFLPEVDLADARFRLAAGDVLLLYTDGATDARPHRVSGGTSPLFGQDALAAALAGCAGLDAAGIIARLSGILAEHSGDWASDDTALLALRVPPGTCP
jgi:serine phosphatase RsbU (regulator of sigma subunit)